MSDEIQHPEQRENETLLINTDDEGFCRIAFKTKRKGKVAYATDGTVVKYLFPVFVKTKECIENQRRREYDDELFDSYLKLKNHLDLDKDTKDAYITAIAHPVEYDQIISDQVDISIKSFEIGMSLLSMGEVCRELYNGTHRAKPDGTVVDLPGTQHLARIGKYAFECIELIKALARIAEEWATTQISCDKTVTISYV